MACFPDFVWEEGRYIFSNHCDVIDVHSAEYGPLIVKIPRSNNYELEHEAATLEYFSGIALDILTPEVVYLDPDKRYLIYKKIEGNVLSWSDFQGINKDKAFGIYGKLAQFLYKTHNLRLPDSFELRQDPTQQYPLILEKRLEDLPDAVRDFTERLLNSPLRQEFEREQASHLIFNDIHPENLVLNDELELVGIIDFGFVSMGNPHRDFHQMDKVCSTGLRSLISLYNDLTVDVGEQIDIQKVRWLSLIDLITFYRHRLLTETKGVHSLEEIRSMLERLIKNYGH